MFKTGESGVLPSPLTMEECHAHVVMKICLAREVLMEKSSKLAAMESDALEKIGQLKMQELRVEHLQRAYTMEVAVTKHLEEIYGSTPAGNGQLTAEAEALRRKLDAENTCLTAWMVVRNHASDLEKMCRGIATLQRILGVWEGDIDGHAECLYKWLRQPGIKEEAAFQNAGLECMCEDPACQFPFNIDANHEHL